VTDGRRLTPAAVACNAPVPPLSKRRQQRPEGPAGAGHFVKMIHNGIEYGIMAAYAEGLNILRHANVEQPAAAA
jgi:6-phosphogluconate dehydrogenase (decarboxylating)